MQRRELLQKLGLGALAGVFGFGSKVVNAGMEPQVIPSLPLVDKKGRFYDSGIDRPSFIHPPENPLEAVEKLRDELRKEVFKLQEIPTVKYNVMGVDQLAGKLRCVITTSDGKTVTREIAEKNGHFYGDEPFEGLASFMQQYQINLCVIDAYPDQLAAMKFAKKFPGCVKLCRYNNYSRTNLFTHGDDGITIRTNRDAWFNGCHASAYRDMALLLVKFDNAQA